MTQSSGSSASPAQAATGTPASATSADVPVLAQPQAPIPPGGGRVIIDQEGNRTTITSSELPDGIVPIARMAQETALGLMGLLAAIFILGPFARMIARRMEKRPELKATSEHTQALQRQIAELQQSIDAMSVEVERISEAQRFQSKLLYERAPASGIPS
jgi:hypothetical protein